MIEVAKLIVDTVVKQLDIGKLLAYRKAKKRTDIGYRLFQLYVELTSMYLAGVALVDEIERVLAASKKNKNSKINTPLKAMIARQRSAVKNCLIAFGELYLQYLLLLDPSIVDNLREVKAKELRFRELSELDWAAEPVKITDADLDEYVKRPRSPALTQQPEFKKDRISPRTIETLKKHLKKHKPREGLANIKKAIDSLHKAISDNFKVEDLLLKVDEGHSSKIDLEKTKYVVNGMSSGLISVLPSRLSSTTAKLHGRA
jgi:hypothetical protein